MASTKRSRRYRASVPSGSFSSSIALATSNSQEGRGGGVHMLSILKTDDRSHPNAHVRRPPKCQTMNEKEIRQLCFYLKKLKKSAAEEMRRSVYATYAAFIRTSQEISDLKGKLLSMRKLLSNQAVLIHSIAEGVKVESLSVGSDSSSSLTISSSDDLGPSELQKWLVEFPLMLDVLLAERRVNEFLDALDDVKRIASDTKENNKLSGLELKSLHKAISDRCQKLANQLAEATCKPSTRRVELRAAASALHRIGDSHCAHSLLLNAHNERLQYNIQTIHPTSTSYGGAYTTALSKQVFSAIAQAVNDSLEVFGNEPAYILELVDWATKQTEAFAQFVISHALASSAVAGDLRAATECIQIALGYCSLLETHGLALCSVLMNLFKPSLEKALDANLKRIEESTAALTVADDWVLTYLPCGPCSSSRMLSTNSNVQPKLSSSAHCFSSMVQDFLDDVGPLLSKQLGGSTLNGLLKAFNSYVDLLINALPSSLEDEENFDGSGNKVVSMAETEVQQLALLANASFLAEELLPCATMELSRSHQSNSMHETCKKALEKYNNKIPEQREWKKKLQRSVDTLRDSFCRHHALNLIFDEDGETNLNADMYINIDGSCESDWSPSPIFQSLIDNRLYRSALAYRSHGRGRKLNMEEGGIFTVEVRDPLEGESTIKDLYGKLNKMACIAADMFVGREKFVTLLLMRLTETVILWLSEDQRFWKDIEEGPRALGPLGLQQFYLDMQFVILFGEGQYLSRHVHQVITDIIERAMAAFSATGMDPDSVLPSDDWFIDIAHKTISRISGKVSLGYGEREKVNSRIASKISMLSIRSDWRS